MGFVQSSDLTELLQDAELMSDLAKAVVETPGVADSLAEDIAGEIQNGIENAPELRKQIVGAAMTSPDFRNKLAAALLDDD